MRRLGLIISFITLLSATVTAQKTVSEGRYFRISGKINQNLIVNLSLVMVRDSLFGECFYTVTREEKSGNGLPDGRTRIVYGKVNRRGDFTLREWNDAKGPVISGQLKPDDISSVKWTLRQNGNTHSFLPVEYYPTGSARFRIYYLSDQKNLIADKKGPRARVKLAIAEVESGAPQLRVDTLNALIMKVYGENKRTPKGFHALLSETVKDFFADYVNTNEPLTREAGGAGFDWELIKYLHVYSNKESKVTMMVLTYSFTGGAHGMENLEFFTVDLHKGSRIRLKDIFKNGYEPKLAAMLTDKLHRMTSIPSNARLTDNGYFTDVIQPTDNFYINPNGVGFVYNQYEIAPYSFGTTDIFLTHSDLVAILK
jgi:hypothetical protein